MHNVVDWWDWTTGSENKSNTSPLMMRLESEVEIIIKDSAHDLIGGRTGMVAGLIMAQLAHKYGLVPSTKTERVI